MARSGHARVPAGQLAGIAPLRSDRALTDPEPPSSYGLDRPWATLDYVVAGGPTITIDLGSSDFDHHFVYAVRAGDPRIFLLPSGPLRPVLALVGVDVPPAT